MAEKWTIDDEAYERLSEEAQNVGLEAHELAPTRSSWGLYSYGDAPGGMGGGVGAFMWFEERKALLDFVGRLLAFFAPGRSDIDPGRVSKDAAEIVSRAASGALDLVTAKSELNKCLVHFSQIEWWGTLEDLLSGDTEYARDLRIRFRGIREESVGDDPSPIKDEEVEGFDLMLSEMGI